MQKYAVFLFSLLLAFVAISNYVFAQSPQGISYQAVVRNASGDLVTSTDISVRISIRETSVTGNVVYQESSLVTSNSFGLINLVVGQGTPLQGTVAGIDWSSDSHFLQVEVDIAGGTAYVDLGTNSLWSVPYALYGADEDADPTNELQTLSVSGSTLAISSGNTVAIPSFWNLNGLDLVNNSGSRVGIGTGLPNATLDVNGPIHNVGEQFTHTKEGTYLEYNKELNGISYILNQKGLGNGGFYVGAVNQADNIDHWLFINGDGEVGINNLNPEASLDIVSPVTSPRVRTDAGGWYVHDLLNNFRAGIIDQKTASYTGIYGDGISNTPQIVMNDGNIGLGITQPVNKLDIVGGNGVVMCRTSVSNNRIRGGFIIGTENSTYYDQWAGMLSWQEGGTDQASLVFYTSYGVRESRMTIKETGEVSIGINSNAYKLYVNGTAGKPGGGSWTAASDARLKQNVQVYTDGLQQLLQIKPVSYQYNDKTEFDTDVTHIGVLAQDLKEVAPYMVGTFEMEGQQYFDVNNSAMTYMLINAVKEQQQQIEQLQTENDALKAENDEAKLQNQLQNDRLQVIEQQLNIDGTAKK